MSGELLEVRGLTVEFRGVRALGPVSFTLGAGETLGLVGESGAGKSTLARALLRLLPAARGAVLWQGIDLLSCDAATLRRHRRDLQIVFQDPAASLDPRMTVGETLAEPLRIHERGLRGPERRMRAARMLDRVGLAEATLDRYPHELSGGQCQRVGIARAMMLQPRLLVCDEPVSALDVSIQGQIVNLLIDLQGEFATSMLFISHNLAVVRHLSHRVMVIYRGGVVEAASSAALFEAPAHPYTRALLAAVPDPTRARRGLGASKAPAAPPPPRGGAAARSGCAYLDCCPHAQPGCARTDPPLEPVRAGHTVACLRWRDLQAP